MERQNLKTKVTTERCGFTIAEVLMVVVVVALLAGIGGGFYAGTYRRMAAKKAAKDFWFAAKYAQITAIDRQSPCELELDTNDNRFLLLVYELNKETGQTEQVPVRGLYSRPVQFGDDIKFEDIKITPIGSEEIASTNEEKTIVFQPNGTAQSTVIQIGDGKNHYTVSICAATGKATMHFGTAKEVKGSTIDLDEEL